MEWYLLETREVVVGRVQARDRKEAMQLAALKHPDRPAIRVQATASRACAESDARAVARTRRLFPGAE
jgi:hypothetical protein